MRVYRLLFRRSISTSAVVYAAIASITLVHHATTGVVAGAIGIASFSLGFAGPILVQGALVEIVRNIHDGRAPERISALFGVSRQRIWPLIGASLLYALGFFGGLILLIVPGLIVAARWSLMAPGIVLEGLGVGASQARSRSLVIGQTRQVFYCVAVLYLFSSLIVPLLWLTSIGSTTYTVLAFAWSTLTAPLTAHALTVIYYRLSEPDRPVVDPAVMTWGSVWTAH